MKSPNKLTCHIFHISRCDVGEVPPTSLTTEVESLCVYSCDLCPASAPLTSESWGSMCAHQKKSHGTKTAPKFQARRHLAEARYG